MLFVFKKDEELNDEETRKEKRLFYLLALSLVPRLKHGDEYLLHEIIASCLFNMNFWSSLMTRQDDHDSSDSLVNELAALKLSEQCEYASGEQTIRIDASAVRAMESTHIYACLNQIKLAYLSEDCLVSKRSVEHSRFIYEGANGNETTKPKTMFVSSRNSTKLLTTSDWMYLPIVRAVQVTEAFAKTKDYNPNKVFIFFYIYNHLF